MTGSDRRADIIQQIKESRTPVSGTKLALRYEAVSYTHLYGLEFKSTMDMDIGLKYQALNQGCLLYTSRCV